MTTATSGSAGSATTRYFQGHRSRTDWRNASGWSVKPGASPTYTFGPRQATVYQCDMHRVLELDLDHREYTVTELGSDGQPVNGEGEQPATPPRRPGGVVHVSVDVHETGDVREMFGHVARRYIITRKQLPEAGACAIPQESVTDGWFIDVDEPRGDCREQPNVPAGGWVETYLAADGCNDQYIFQHSGPTPLRFPVEQTITVRAQTPNRQPVANKSGFRVTELSEQPLDPALFELPTGFKHVDKLNTDPSPPLFFRARTAWEGVKRTVKGWWPW